MEIQYGSINVWPGKLRSTWEQKSAPFKRSTMSDTLKLLQRELKMVSAEGAVCQLAIGLTDLNRDGTISARARPKHAGVILSFRKPSRNAAGQRITVPLNFPCDRFSNWQDNLRAVAIALEDLRRIDRYGVTQNSEQYAGFKALPPPGPSHESISTVEEAATWLGIQLGSPPQSNRILVDPEPYRYSYRLLAAKFHPDAGGSAIDWAKLQAAKTLLDAHHHL